MNDLFVKELQSSDHVQGAKPMLGVERIIVDFNGFVFSVCGGPDISEAI